MSTQRDFAHGVQFALGAFLFWGLVPLYWFHLRHVPAFEILQHRIVWAFALTWVVLIATKRVPSELFAPHRRRELFALLGAGVLVSANWFVYVFAITNGRTVEASLGYYINPLVTVLLGVVVLGERLSTAQRLSLGIAAAGVIYLTVELGRLPWVSLALAFTFGIYGLVKKQTRVSSVQGLAIETLPVVPIALIFVIIHQRDGTAAFLSGDPLTSILLVGGGLVTITPLMLFANATRRIPLSSVGFIQYLAPTLVFLVGVFIFREPFPLIRLPGFVLVWIALFIYTVSIVPRRRRRPYSEQGSTQ